MSSARRRRARTSKRLGIPAGGVAIVGPGRVGQALGKLLAQAGYAVDWVAARRLAAARRAVRFIGSGKAVGLDSPRLTEAGVLVLTVADSALKLLARDLARRRRDWSGKIVLHTCGSLPSAVLQPLHRRGAAIGSLHPFQTVPSPQAGVRNLPGGYWGIEGDAAARKLAFQWVKALRGIAFPLRASQKTLYHASAFLVSPTLVTLMDRSVYLLRRAGVPAGIARPMLGRFVSETITNFLKLGGRRALTGPAVRGDWSTIRRHLRALRRVAPDVLPAYGVLLRAMLRLGGRRLPPSLERVMKR
jgi:predicted short-subunit dehydrogenase-like oxidoreductase (DUF2520 family)